MKTRMRKPAKRCRRGSRRSRRSQSGAVACVPSRQDRFSKTCLGCQETKHSTVGLVHGSLTLAETGSENLSYLLTDRAERQSLPRTGRLRHHSLPARYEWGESRREGHFQQRIKRERPLRFGAASDRFCLLSPGPLLHSEWRRGRWNTGRHFQSHESFNFRLQLPPWTIRGSFAMVPP
jgi:hypothetical protein